MSENEINETDRIKEYKNRDKASESEERNDYRRSKSAIEQIEILDKRVGKGVGAKSERARLNKLIEKSNNGRK